MTEQLLSAVPATCPVLIGRRPVLRSIEQRIDAAAGGRGQALILSGEAGIGKSRLVAETKASAEQRGFLSLQGNCFEPDRGLSYAPLVDLLRSFIAGRPDEENVRAFGGFAAELIWLLPEFADRVAANIPARAPTSGWEKRRFLQTLADFFVRLTVAGDDRPAVPLLAIVEDLHWSDESTLEFLLFFARRLAEQPIFLLLTRRSDEVTPALGHFLAALDRQRLVTEITPERLNRTEVDAMVRAILELQRPARIEFLDAIYGLTEGNPFFVEELLKSMILSGEIFYHAGRWQRTPSAEMSTMPRTVQDAVQRRLAGLSPAGQKTATLAAVTGRRFNFALLQELTGLSEAELLSAIKELIGARVLVEESAEQFAFLHALTREVVYSGLLKRERRQYHRAVAETMERLYAQALESHEGELAVHFHEAEAWEKAVAYARRAAERAGAIYALPEAAGHYTLALKAAGHLPSTDALGPLHDGRGHVYETLGDFAEAQADYETAVALARSAGDLPGQWQALLDLGFLWSARDYRSAGGYLEQALALARQIEDSATLGHTLNRVGNWYANRGQLTRARSHHEEALSIFETLKDRSGLAETWDLLGLTALNQGDVVRMTDCYEHAIGLFRALHDRRGLSSALANFAQRGPAYPNPLQVATGMSLDETRRDVEEALRLAREIGWRSGEAYALIVFANLCLWQGEFVPALALLGDAVAIAEEIEHRQWLTAAHGALAALYYDLLDLDRAQEQADVALEHARVTNSVTMMSQATSWRALLHAKRGNLIEAENLLNADAGSEPDMATFPQRIFWYARAQLALARGDAGGALRIAERICAATPNMTTEAVAPMLWILRGEALAAQRRSGEAEALLRAACTALKDQRCAPLLWQTHIALGKVHRLQRRRDLAEAEFQAARAVIEALAAQAPHGSLRDNFRARALAQIPALASPSALRVAKQAYGGLTARERQVAALIAMGKSNREIAGSLVISERTVETHVASILAKLGLNARTQIAAWAVEHGLKFDPSVSA